MISPLIIFFDLIQTRIKSNRTVYIATKQNSNYKLLLHNKTMVPYKKLELLTHIQS